MPRVRGGCCLTAALSGSLALCLFSLLVVVKSWPIVFAGFMRHGWVGLHCDTTFWDSTDFGFWARLLR